MSDLLCESIGGGLLEIPADRGVVAVAITGGAEFFALDHQDVGDALHRIDPGLRAERPPVAV